MHFSFFTYFSVSRHNPGPTVCISYFSRFSVFLAIFQVLQCLFLIFHYFPFSRHTPCPTFMYTHTCTRTHMQSHITMENSHRRQWRGAQAEGTPTLSFSYLSDRVDGGSCLQQQLHYTDVVLLAGDV